ncbi:MAG: ATP-binding protein [Verrucomicrobiota bacterium]
MTKRKGAPVPEPVAGLRVRAEEEAGNDKTAKGLSPRRAQEVLHELRVHQIELEMQNEELRRTQKELEASRERYFDLYDLAPVGYLTLSRQGLIVEANLTAAKLLGLKRNDLVHRSITHFILFADDESYQEHLKQLFESGDPQLFDLRMVRRDASHFWARFETTRIKDNDGSFLALAILSDITAQKDAEEALKKSEEAAEAANRAKDQFIAVLSHELRTPLTPVLATVSALRTEKDLPPPLRSDIELIQRNVETEAELIDDLLDVTRISQGKVVLQPEILDMHTCLQMALEVCQPQISAKRLEHRLDFQACRHHVWADPVRMRQVCWNLLKNAVKFTPEGGRVTLRTYNSGERLKIEIEDTGIGIDPKIMPEIFHPFKQGDQISNRQFGGLGLGLSIAKAVMELHQGRLTAYSEGRNKGATFTIELATVNPEAEPPASAPQREHEEHPLRILLVEDHADTLQVLFKLLKDWGHSVTTAGCVRKALELAAGQPFDLLISDLGLPDNSGLTLMRQVKKSCGIPGIALSGYGTEEDLRESQTAGFTKHLIKPVNVADLRVAIRQVA